MPNGNFAPLFNGKSYLEWPDTNNLSITTTGKLSIVCWLNLGALDFPCENYYVHWFGKGTYGEHEYAGRLYQKTSDRPNRISFYAFNAIGGLGAGAYIQDDVRRDDWHMIVGTYDYPNNKISVYKDAILRDTKSFDLYPVVPSNTKSPLRLGNRNSPLGMCFRGGLGKFAIYNRALKAKEILLLNNTMAGPKALPVIQQ
jgi:hypothetical protein